jgi:hypothetical protein
MPVPHNDYDIASLVANASIPIIGHDSENSIRITWLAAMAASIANNDFYPFMPNMNNNNK